MFLTISIRYWLESCLYSSPCPRCPPLPFVLAIVALGGGVGEGGKPGSHQAGHHLPIVVVVASWEWNQRNQGKGIQSNQRKTHFSLQAELEYLATSRVGRKSGMEDPPARSLGSQSCCTEAVGEEIIEICKFVKLLSPLPQRMLEICKYRTFVTFATVNAGRRQMRRKRITAMLLCQSL